MKLWEYELVQQSLRMLDDMDHILDTVITLQAINLRYVSVSK